MAYLNSISEAAEAEIEAAYLWVLRRSPEGAGRWYEGLLRAIESLSEIPNRCPLARENDGFEPQIRQLLYGRGQTAYRILFMVMEPGEPEEEPTVRIPPHSPWRSNACRVASNPSASWTP